MSLELGINHFREQQFQECYEVLSSFCISNTEDISQKILALDYLLRISKFLDVKKQIIKISISLLKESDQKSKEKIISLVAYKADSLWNLSLNSDEFYEIAKSYEDVGAFSKASEFLDELCELFLNNYRINILSKLIQSSTNHKLKHKYKLEYLLIVAISTGDKLQVDSLLGQSVSDIIDRDNFYHQSFSVMRGKLAKNINFWKGNVIYLYEIISRIDGVPVEGAAHDRKKIMNMILDVIMIAPLSVNSYLLLGEYSLKFSVRELCEKTIKTLRVFLKNDDKELLNYIKKLETASLKMKSSANQSNDFDFGEDLFESSTDNDQMLENKLLYFINSNDYDSAKDIYDELNSLRPDSDALNKFRAYESKVTSRRGSGLETSKNLFLANNIQTKNNENVILEAQLNKVIEMFDPSFLNKNIGDIITCLRFLSLNKVIVKQIIGHMEKNSPRVDLLGHLAQAYFDDKDYYKCLDICYETIEVHSLNNDEHCYFLYLIAESYLSIDMKRKALEVYTKILSLNKSYRMTNERIREINEV